MSTPVVKSDNASGLKRNFTAPVSVDEGHAKVPFSKRFTSTQSPVPSQYNIFNRERFRFENTNNAPCKGSVSFPSRGTG